jgi:hypothetical protein
MKSTLLLIIMLLIGAGCSSNDASPKADELKGACAYEARKTVGNLTNTQGTIKVTQTGTDTWTDIYVDEDLATRYCACNLPASYAEEGLRIRFSAQIKEIAPNEKWRCQPIKLTSLQLLSTTEK